MGGLDPAHENAETVLVVDLLPQHAGADINVPQHELSIDLHVSHHGARELSGVVRAAWVDAGARFDAVTEYQVESALVQAVPFQLSETVQVVVPAPGGPARLMLWLVDDRGAIAACTFVDAASIEPPNHRGARVAD